MLADGGMQLAPGSKDFESRLRSRSSEVRAAALAVSLTHTSAATIPYHDTFNQPAREVTSSQAHQST